jgi:catalase
LGRSRPDAGAQALPKGGGVKKDAGVVDAADTRALIGAAGSRQWNREPKVCMLP